MRVLVVVPTFDEAATLSRVVTGVRASGAELLVVDDASPDGTGQIADDLAAADPGVHVLHRASKSGLGSAYVAGFEWGLAEGFDVLCEMDADLSHDPEDLPRLLALLDAADVVLGSRYVPGGGVRDWPWQRRVLSRAGNRYVRLLTGMPLADATSGFRAYRRVVIEWLDLSSVRSEGYAFQVETVLRAWRLGFEIAEVPITFVERRHGASKISRTIVAEALLRVARWGLTGPRRPAGRHPGSITSARQHDPSEPGDDPASDARDAASPQSTDGQPDPGATEHIGGIVHPDVHAAGGDVRPQRSEQPPPESAS